MTIKRTTKYIVIRRKETGEICTAEKDDSKWIMTDSSGRAWCLLCGVLRAAYDLIEQRDEAPGLSAAVWVWADYANAIIEKRGGYWLVSTPYDNATYYTAHELEELARFNLNEMATSLSAQGVNDEGITRALSAA